MSDGPIAGLPDRRDPTPPAHPASPAATGPAPTILFVDDEEDVLAGLRLVLRRQGYNLRFALSADDAVAILDQEPVDLVVTDMRMPERSGADLLDELRFRFPDVIRYVLSGQAEDRLIRRSVAVTHRWLHKPCPAELLIDALAEATARRAQITEPAVRRAIGAVDALPSHPDIHAGLVEVLASHRATSDQVAGLAALDPALSLKLLQWANSTRGIGQPIHDVRRAVDRIGLSTLGQLSSADDIIRPVGSTEVIPGFGIDLFHRHARAVASLAASLTGPEQAELASTGGLLSDIGLLIEVSQLRDRLEAVYERAQQAELSLLVSERQAASVTHPDLGAHLLALWGLPPALVEVVALGHGLPDIHASLPLSPVDAVRAARLLAQRLPLAQAIGRPHLTRFGPEVSAALDRWADELNLGQRFQTADAADA